MNLGSPGGEPTGAPSITVLDGQGTGIIADATALTAFISDAASVTEGGQLNLYRDLIRHFDDRYYNPVNVYRQGRGWQGFYRCD